MCVCFFCVARVFIIVVVVVTVLFSLLSSIRSNQIRLFIHQVKQQGKCLEVWWVCKPKQTTTLTGINSDNMHMSATTTTTTAAVFVWWSGVRGVGGGGQEGIQYYDHIIIILEVSCIHFCWSCKSVMCSSLSVRNIAVEVITAIIIVSLLSNSAVNKINLLQHRLCDLWLKYKKKKLF